MNNEGVTALEGGCRMENDFWIEEDELWYSLPKEVDQHVAALICKEIDMMIDAGGIRHLVIDFDKTEFMDSSGVGIIIGRSRKLKYFGGKVRVVNLSNAIKRIFVVTNLFSLVEEVE